MPAKDNEGLEGKLVAMSMVSETSQNRPNSPPVVVNDNNTVTVHPRRKSGSYRDAPVVTVTLERLSKLYGHSIEEAARQLVCNPCDPLLVAYQSR